MSLRIVFVVKSQMFKMSAERGGFSDCLENAEGDFISVGTVKGIPE